MQVVVECARLLTDGSLDVRLKAKHLMGELVQHSRTENLLSQHLSDLELRGIKKTLESLR